MTILEVSLLVLGFLIGWMAMDVIKRSRGEE